MGDSDDDGWEAGADLGCVMSVDVLRGQIEGLHTMQLHRVVNGLLERAGRDEDARWVYAVAAAELARRLDLDPVRAARSWASAGRVVA